MAASFRMGESVQGTHKGAAHTGGMEEGWQCPSGGSWVCPRHSTEEQPHNIEGLKLNSGLLQDDGVCPKRPTKRRPTAMGMADGEQLPSGSLGLRKAPSKDQPHIKVMKDERRLPSGGEKACPNQALKLQ